MERRKMVSESGFYVDPVSGGYETAKREGRRKYAGRRRTGGDAAIIDGGDSQIATYEWYESSQRIIFTYSDERGDTIEAVYEYEIDETSGTDMTQSLTPVATTSSLGTRTYDDLEATILYKE